MTAPMVSSALPLPLWRRGKVREVYEVDRDRLLLVASDRVSAFDFVLSEPVPDKGKVLTQLSAFWFRQLADISPSHFITATTDDILAEVPVLAAFRDQLAGRAMLVKRTDPIAFECVVRGYLSGSAWAEYRNHGTLAGEPLPAGLEESTQLLPPIFSPATKAETGHDENVPFGRMRNELGAPLADQLRELANRLFQAGSVHAAKSGLIIADTKFEFGLDIGGEPIVIDEILTPDSSRFWPATEWRPGSSPPSFDKQPLRDWLMSERHAGRWDGEATPPRLPEQVIAATTTRYREAFRLLTGSQLPEDL
jgi:phosphoribosylaminoimidazole-succinocarboxamide synthase